ncbi:hypothetical protein BASA84_001291 [Batrachochytrium salamandrivorans]|nr:hypothetical protein BASA84_001291 [Batrachochytrium salamandrivorans]
MPLCLDLVAAFTLKGGYTARVSGLVNAGSRVSYELKFSSLPKILPPNITWKCPNISCKCPNITPITHPANKTTLTRKTRFLIFTSSTESTTELLFPTTTTHPSNLLLRSMWLRHIAPKLHCNLISHILVLFPVVIAYVYLLRAAVTLPLQAWPTLIPRAFQTLLLPASCNTDLPALSLAAPDEASGKCDLDIYQFQKLLVLLLGSSHSMTAAETMLLHDSLDITRNGRVSWGELTHPLMSDGRCALQIYLNYWRQAQQTPQTQYLTGDAAPPLGFGLLKLQPVVPLTAQSS